MNDQPASTPPPGRRPGHTTPADVLCQQIIASSQAGIFALDRELRIRIWNQAMQEFTGRTPMELAGKRLLEVLPDLRQEGLEPLLKEALAGRRVTAPDQCSPAFLHQGQPVWVTIRLGPICDADGVVVGVLASVSDITGRKQAEQRLVKSEEQFRSLIELAVDAIFLQDSAGRCLQANTKACELTGYAREELLRMRLADLFSSEELRLHPLRNDLLQQGQTVMFLRTMTRKDGSHNPIEMNSKMMPDGTIQTFLRDISERVQAEEALQEALRRFENVIQSTPLVAIQGFDRQGVVQHWNEASARLFGIRAEQAVGQRVQELLLSGQEALDFEELLETVWSSGQSSPPREWRTSPPDAKARWVYSSLFPVLEHGKVVEVFCMDVDITERKQAEESLQDSEAKLRSIINTIPYPIFSKDTQLRYTECNNAFIRFLGLSREQIVGKTVYDVAPKENADVYHKADLALLETGGGQSYQARSVAADKTSRDVIFHKGVYLDGEGRAAGLVGIMVDITEQKRAEETLQQSESRFRSLFSNMAEGVALHRTIRDEHGTPVNYQILDVNPRFEAILGLQREQVVGKLATEAYQAAEAPYLERFTRVGETGQPDYFETYFAPMDKHFAISIAPLGPGQWATIFSDITERKRTERRIQESNARLEATLNALPDLLFEVDREGRIYDFRAPHPELLYAPPAEFLGKRMDEVVPREAAQVINAALADAAEHGIHRGAVYSLKMPSGYDWFELSIAARGDPKAPDAHFIMLVHDITAVRQTEEELRIKDNAIASSINAIAIANAVGAVTYVNPAFLSLWGYEHPSEVLGRSVVSFWQSEQEAARVVEALLDKGGCIGELVGRRKNNSLFDVSLTASLVRDETGKPISMMGSFVDITQRKELEVQLRQSQKLEGIGQMAGGVAHDFNNILTVILGNASLLLSQPNLSPENREVLEQIAEAGNRASNLTRHLLAFSRQQPMKPEDLDVNEVVNQLATMLRRIIGEDIDLTVRYASAPTPIRGDASMIGQVLLNLTVNARDAMPQGGRLTIATETVQVDAAHVQRQPAACEGRFVRLTVQDTGAGIPPEALPHIFEPFFTTKEVGKGTGLGLAMVYGVVQQHQGWIEVESSLGAGTSFHVYLPFHEMAPQHSKHPVASSRWMGGTETVLLVEDEEAVLALARNCLERCGYRVLSAGNGREAVALLDKEHPQIDLLLTDLVMPGGMTGRQLAEKLRAANPALKVVFTSGYSLDMPAVAELGAGTVFLPKPYELPKLTKVVRDCLDTKQGAPG